jgi:hypothetical protein
MGLPGPAGTATNTGATGPTGAQGLMGLSGPTGNTGPTGPTSTPITLAPTPLIGPVGPVLVPVNSTVLVDDIGGAVDLILPVAGSLADGDEITVKSVLTSIGVGIMITAGAGTVIEDPSSPDDYPASNVAVATFVNTDRSCYIWRYIAALSTWSIVASS